VGLDKGYIVGYIVASRSTEPDLVLKAASRSTELKTLDSSYGFLVGLMSMLADGGTRSHFL
jgi:hypothetical protein